MDQYFSIKNAAKLTDLSPSNIRYYESEGLIQHIDRDANGIRRFGQKEIQWIRFLGKLKKMEMPIAQMKEYAVFREQGDATIQDRIKLLEQHKQYLLKRIDRLLNDVQLLEDKINIYHTMEEKSNE